MGRKQTHTCAARVVEGRRWWRGSNVVVLDVGLLCRAALFMLDINLSVGLRDCC